MTEAKPLTSKEKKSARRAFITIGIMLPMILLFLFTGRFVLAALSFITFLLILIYGVTEFDGETTIGEAFNFGDEKYQERLRKGRGDRKKRKLTDRTDIKNSKLREQVSDRMAEGWTIEKIDNSSNRVVMSSTKGGNIAGHAVTGFLTGLWTFGAGNVVYNELSKKRNKERIAVSLEGSPTSQSSSDKYAEGLEILSKLNDLRQNDAITQEEYEDKKEQILEDIS